MSEVYPNITYPKAKMIFGQTRIKALFQEQTASLSSHFSSVRHIFGPEIEIFFIVPYQVHYHAKYEAQWTIRFRVTSHESQHIMLWQLVWRIMLLRTITHLSTWVKFVVQIVLYKVSFHTKFQVIWPTRLGVIVVESFSRDERELAWLKAHKIVFFFRTTSTTYCRRRQRRWSYRAAKQLFLTIWLERFHSQICRTCRTRFLRENIYRSNHVGSYRLKYGFSGIH